MDENEDETTLILMITPEYIDEGGSDVKMSRDNKAINDKVGRKARNRIHEMNMKRNSTDADT